MCGIFKVHFSGFYAWVEKPLSNRAIEDQRLLKLIKQFYMASGATYGSPWIHRDMREAGETCSVHRVARIMRENNLDPSMSRRGNCHDNAVAESFFATFKKRVTQRKIYSTREEAKGEIFNFIEMFYNPVKRHSHTGGVSPAKFEENYFSKLESV